MLITITPDKEKAASIIKMVDVTQEMVAEINHNKFPSNVTKEYYEIIRELISVILLLDGYKTLGEGAHRELIEYLQTNYKEINQSEIELIEKLRKIRNKIAYDGFFVNFEFIERNKNQIINITTKLKSIISSKW